MLEVGDRLEDPVAAGVADVVVGDPDPVEPGIGEALDQLRVGREDRPVRVVAERVRGRILEVGDRDVRRLDEMANGTGVTGPGNPRQVPAER